MTGERYGFIKIIFSQMKTNRQLHVRWYKRAAKKKLEKDVKFKFRRNFPPRKINTNECSSSSRNLFINYACEMKEQCKIAVSQFRCRLRRLSFEIC